VRIIGVRPTGFAPSFVATASAQAPAALTTARTRTGPAVVSRCHFSPSRRPVPTRAFQFDADAGAPGAAEEVLVQAEDVDLLGVRFEQGAGGPLRPQRRGHRSVASAGVTGRRVAPPATSVIGRFSGIAQPEQRARAQQRADPLERDAARLGERPHPLAAVALQEHRGRPAGGVVGRLALLFEDDDSRVLRPVRGPCPRRRSRLR
jgi:hypothetical protein